MLHKNTITLNYFGGKTDEGLDPIVLSEAIAGFTRLAQKSMAVEFGDTPPFSLRIKRVSEGSVNPEFIFQIVELVNQADEAMSFFLTVSDLIKQSVLLSKHLNGHPPERRKLDGQGNVSITNGDGDVHVFNINAEHLTLNMGGAKDAEQFVRAPLQNDADSFSITPTVGNKLSLTKEESKKVLPINSETDILEHTYTTWLTVIRPVLEGSGKWTFNDGSKKLLAEVADPLFLNRVHEGGESFSNGDSLLVEIKATQEKRNGKLSARFEVLEVFDQEKKAKDGELDFG